MQTSGILIIALLAGVLIWLWMRVKATALLGAGLIFFIAGAILLVKSGQTDNGIVQEIEGILLIIAGIIGIGASAIVSELGRVRKTLIKE